MHLNIVQFREWGWVGDICKKKKKKITTLQCTKKEGGGGVFSLSY